MITTMITGCLRLALAFGLFGWVLCVAASAEEIGARQAHAQAKAGALTIIDVRRPGEWRETGVPDGAVPISLHNVMRMERNEFAEDVLKAVGGDHGRPVALICAGGVRSAKAEALLRAAGFDKVYDINEGMLGNGRDSGWLARGLPVRECIRC